MNIKELSGLTSEQLKALDSVRSETVVEEKEVNTMSDQVDPLDELDAELSSLASEAQAAAVAEEPVQMNPAEQMRSDILALLRSSEGAPDEEQIEAWKSKYGEDGVQVVGFDRGNVFVFTHLTLPQWERIQSILRDAQGSAQADDLQKKLRDTVVRSAVLWPKLGSEWFQSARAGLPDTLYELVLVNSYFLSPQQAMTLTTQL